MINISYICIKYTNNMIGIYKITSPSGRIYILDKVLILKEDLKDITF